MITLFLNAFLAIAWAALTGQFTLINLGFGFALGYLILWLLKPKDRDGVYRSIKISNYFMKIPQLAGFIAFFVWELILANLRVAISVLSPLKRLQPAIVAIPLDIKTDAEITLLANLITLTPGTLSLDVAPDRSMLYVHVLYVEDIEQFRKETKEGFERRVQELFQ
ncbi:MAG: Na+/H+ antiporter subunit E [Gloeobacterales cyanobacterium]